MKDIQEAIKSHKKLTFLIASDVDIKDKSIDYNQILGEEIALFLSGFKCENCSSKNDLTIHHLITKDNKKICPKNKYLSQRYYFFNLVVLCLKCHCKHHHIYYDNDTKKTISKKRIKYISERYYCK